MLVMLELLSVDFLKDLEDLNEEVDDVEVQLDGRHNVFLRTQSGHNHLRKNIREGVQKKMTFLVVFYY